MLGKKFGYYPEDPETAWKVDSWLDAISDLVTQMLKVKFETDAEKQKELFQKFVSEVLPKWLEAIEKRIKANSSPVHLVGDKYTIADFSFGALLSSVFFNEGNEYSAPLQEVIKKFEGIINYGHHQKETCKEYLDARPSPRPF